MDLELLELEQPVIELERCPGMLDIPLQQSGILTFMSLKKLMSVQAAIVRPTHPPTPFLPPSIFLLFHKEKVFHFSYWECCDKNYIVLCEDSL